MAGDELEAIAGRDLDDRAAKAVNAGFALAIERLPAATREALTLGHSTTSSVPGALLLLGSGTWLIIDFYDGWAFLELPWLAGMVLLFAFEFVEGNTMASPSGFLLSKLAATKVSVPEELMDGWSCPVLVG